MVEPAQEPKFFFAVQLKNFYVKPFGRYALNVSPLLIGYCMNRPTAAAWNLYAIEAALAASLMLAVGAYVIALEHPGSPAHQALPHPLARRALMGAAMGLTIAGLIACPWGKRSGAHFNPAVTFAFWWVGQVSWADALGYIVAHYVGACAGMGVILVAAGELLAHPRVNFAATKPGPWGSGWAFVAEFGLAFILLSNIMWFSSKSHLRTYVPIVAGSLVALFVLLAGPVSGMSLNPARTFGSALAGGGFERLWLYCVGPVGGMLAAACLSRSWNRGKSKG